MSFDLAGVASVFGDDESAVRWSYELLCKVLCSLLKSPCRLSNQPLAESMSRVSSSSRNKV